MKSRMGDTATVTLLREYPLDVSNVQMPSRAPQHLNECVQSHNHTALESSIHRPLPTSLVLAVCHNTATNRIHKTCRISPVQISLHHKDLSTCLGPPPLLRAVLDVRVEFLEHLDRLLHFFVQRLRRFEQMKDFLKYGKKRCASEKKEGSEEGRERPGDSSGSSQTRCGQLRPTGQKRRVFQQAE